MKLNSSYNFYLNVTAQYLTEKKYMFLYIVCLWHLIPHLASIFLFNDIFNTQINNLLRGSKLHKSVTIWICIKNNMQFSCHRDRWQTLSLGLIKGLWAAILGQRWKSQKFSFNNYLVCRLHSCHSFCFNKVTVSLFFLSVIYFLFEVLKNSLKC